jgi:hypothetical protein
MKTRDGVEQGCLAAARWANDDRDLAGGHVEGTVIDGENTCILSTVPLYNVNDAHATLAACDVRNWRWRP